MPRLREAERSWKGVQAGWRGHCLGTAPPPPGKKCARLQSASIFFLPDFLPLHCNLWQMPEGCVLKNLHPVGKMGSGWHVRAQKNPTKPPAVSALPTHLLLTPFSLLLICLPTCPHPEFSLPFSSAYPPAPTFLRLYFIEKFGVHSKIERKVQGFLMYRPSPCPSHTHAVSPSIGISHQRRDRRQLKNRYPLMSIVHIRVHWWCGVCPISCVLFHLPPFLPYSSVHS